MKLVFSIVLLILDIAPPCAVFEFSFWVPVCICILLMLNEKVSRYFRAFWFIAWFFGFCLMFTARPPFPLVFIILYCLFFLLKTIRFILLCVRYFKEKCEEKRGDPLYKSLYRVCGTEYIASIVSYLIHIIVENKNTEIINKNQYTIADTFLLFNILFRIYNASLVEDKKITSDSESFLSSQVSACIDHALMTRFSFSQFELNRFKLSRKAYYDGVLANVPDSPEERKSDLIHYFSYLLLADTQSSDPYSVSSDYVTIYDFFLEFQAKAEATAFFNSILEPMLLRHSEKMEKDFLVQE